MKINKTQFYDPYKWNPKFCKHDGKALINARQIKKTGYSEETGEKIETVSYISYCPDWEQARELHTIYFGNAIKEIVSENNNY